MEARLLVTGGSQELWSRKRCSAAWRTDARSPVPAPGAAPVFMSTEAEGESWDPELTQTYETYVYPHGIQMSPGGLVTSNGRGGPSQAQHPLGLGTSRGRYFVGASRNNMSISTNIISSAAAFSVAVFPEALVARKTDY
ncbi:hypothetical protein DL93DRAFT_2078272 [Clavulina sp. PMI_390]|nr:hypothetical protein DL93DRAFT_2078272 [Clavulina sp. PMI_390]